MTIINDIITYTLIFLGLYVEVFFLITYFEVREKESKKVVSDFLLPARLPSVTVIVPCWNEEQTIAKTIHSLLKLDYPRALLSVFVVDDGSTDKTWNVLQRFDRNKQITLLQKPNGGKHMAVNFALEKTTSELVGCLDADLFVHRQALKRIVSHFENKEIMAVTPAMKVQNSSTIIELIQRVEYGWAIFLRQIFAHLDAQYVAPGPFSIFRTRVFHELGFYKHAYNTEDMEMALRMQANHYKIANAPDAIVYTVTPNTIIKLYKQRLRWTYGFMKNVIDYKHLFFRPQYGHLGMIILPTASVSLFSTLYIIGSVVVDYAQLLWNKIVEFQTIGWYWNWNNISFDWFYFNTDIIAFLGFIALFGTIVILFISRKMSEGHMKIGRDLIYFLIFYSFLAPIWIARAFYNVIFARSTKWR